MFERYTENARRAIFFSRYEAGLFGSPMIESEHLLLGLIRASKSMWEYLLKLDRGQASGRAQVYFTEDLRTALIADAPKRGAESTREDLPLTDEGKRILRHAAAEATSLGHQHIGVEHLLLGILREENCFAATFLRQYGFHARSIRSIVNEAQIRQGAQGSGHFPSVTRKAVVTTKAVPNPPQPLQSRLSRFLRRFGISK